MFNRPAVLARFLPVLLLIGVAPLTGCIRNQAYRSCPNCDVVVPPPASIFVDPPFTQGRCSKATLTTSPCLAFLEFDDFGEPWQRNPSGRPTQLNHVTELIRMARQADPDALVVVFVHGWKHNAAESPEDANVAGFKQALGAIRQRMLDRNVGKGVVLGIYVAWRGGSISPDWPVAQQFTYFNREAAAIRVGNTSLTDALVEISYVSRSQAGNFATLPPARLVMVGHSFGALVLERATSQAMLYELEQQYQEQRPLGTPTQGNVPNAIAIQYGAPVVATQGLADLIVFVNSAAGANEGKQMMDYLASSHFTYQSLPPGAERPRAWPLILSITSATDTATGLFFKIGHGASWLGYATAGSMRGSSAPPDSNALSDAYSRVCYDPSRDPKQSCRRFDMSQTSFYMTTTAHSPQLQSHVVAERPAGSSDIIGRCNTQNAVLSCDVGQYVFSVSEKPNRCNGTPYWVMEVPKELIPDHGTIFTNRLIVFLSGFLDGTVLTTQEERPQLYRSSMQ